MLSLLSRLLKVARLQAATLVAGAHSLEWGNVEMTYAINEPVAALDIQVVRASSGEVLWSHEQPIAWI